MSTALDLLAEVCRSGWTSVAQSKAAEALRLKAAAAADALIAAAQHPERNQQQLQDP